MNNFPVKNPFDDITSEEVYEKARLQGSIERIFEDFNSCIKNSNSYKSLMEATKQNILGDHFVTIPISDVQSKKKRLQEIALLAGQFDSKVSEFITGTIEVEGKPVIEKIIKQLSYLKKESASKVDSPSKNGQTSADANVGSYHERPLGTANNVWADEDSYDSVSSVHTSDLSSLSDEMEVPTENRGSNGKKPKIISYKAVRKAYKSMVEKKKKKPIKQQKSKGTSKACVSTSKACVSTSKACVSTSKACVSTSKACVSSSSKGSDETEPLPKRQRKPNSRYIS